MPSSFAVLTVKPIAGLVEGLLRVPKWLKRSHVAVEVTRGAWASAC
eukprot:CAMPEP_0175892818 /NCGR_PEP_ID=MMETSP0107_2-20121207/49122_1 /TAXON_ID=195067 ORGANISM="Goniomonas pacifica, Strain CCMP1869" /NCGR_SAMPLE_ID=MMETSP0107_2 /ASSEMBLY_ACC=CAM_ASM_000203 /LENGTH=45 /DNA_ID= /DNA_START= /DNA_END= /DNA_ORIENTATION=